MAGLDSRAGEEGESRRGLKAAVPATAASAGPEDGYLHAVRFKFPGRGGGQTGGGERWSGRSPGVGRRQAVVQRAASRSSPGRQAWLSRGLVRGERKNELKGRVVLASRLTCPASGAEVPPPSRGLVPVRPPPFPTLVGAGGGKWLDCLDFLSASPLAVAVIDT